MQAKLSFLLVKLQLSARTTAWVLRQWRYSILALIVALLFFELVYWLFNLNILTVILGSAKVSIFDKIQFLFDPITSLADVMGGYTASLMLTLSIVQGVNVAVLSYVLRHQKKVDAAALGGGTFVGILAVIGIGCPACGTSLITPLVALFVSGSAVAVSESITKIALPIALLAGVYGLYTLGIKAANVRALDNQ